MEEDPDNNDHIEEVAGRKVKAPDQYKRNIIKKARLSGDPYVSHKNVEKPGLNVGPPCK